MRWNYFNEFSDGSSVTCGVLAGTIWVVQVRLRCHSWH